MTEVKPREARGQNTMTNRMKTYKLQKRRSVRKDVRGEVC